MKNSFGNRITLTLFGESHGEELGIVIDGLAPGIEISEEYIASKLALRRPCTSISTARVENDDFRIVSGVFEKMTTGAPLCIIIPNKDIRSKDYEKIRFLARPGHADYSAYAKYHGFEDYRGGGHFSGRLTAPIVAAGAIFEYALEKKGIYIGTHIKRLARIDDASLCDDIPALIELSKKTFPTVSDDAAQKMLAAAEEAAKDGDSVGGILETSVVGMPAGVGEPWFDSVESMLSHALFSIPAVKGVEFGAGFAIADKRGSKANDAFFVKDGKIVTDGNSNGGINGGITNGMPIRFCVAIKPTPSIKKEQNTVNFKQCENAVISVGGRHDAAIVHRARAVVDAVTAHVLCDLLSERFGTDFLGKTV